MGNKKETSVESSNASENLKEEFERTGKIHIEKNEDGKKVVVDIDNP